MELTISLVLYNSKACQVERLLTSLDLQEDVSFKLVILDNAKHPEPFLPRKFPVDYVKSSINLGFGRAHNENFRKTSRSKYFLVINPDIYFSDPLLLRKTLDRMNATPQTGLCSVKILNPDNSIQEVHRLLPRFADILKRFTLNKLKIYTPYKETYTLSHFDKTQTYPCPSISGCFMLFRSETFQYHKGFDEQLFLYFEDVDLSRRCYFSSGGCNMVYGDLAVYHTWSRQGYKSLDAFKKHVLSAAYYFQKYGILRDKYSLKVNTELESFATHLNENHN
jgi:GT2 family glycosyltransferase